MLRYRTLLYNVYEHPAYLAHFRVWDSVRYGGHVRIVLKVDQDPLIHRVRPKVRL
jgi:hypothetical protein